MPDSSPSAAAAALADRLRLASREAFDASLDLLEHFPDTGDRRTDAALNDLAEQAADTLRAVAEVLGERASRVSAAAAGQHPAGPVQRRPRSRALDGFGHDR